MLRVMTSSGRLRALSSLLKAASAPPHRGASPTWSARHAGARRRHYSAQHIPPPSPSNLSEPEMVRRLMRSQRVWWWLGSLVLGGVGLVAFGPELKIGMSRHTAELASRSLQDETLRDNTRELASQIVQTVLNDPKVLDQASRFLQRLVVMDSTREALRALVIHTLNDPMTRAQVAELTKHAVTALMEEPKTLRQLVDLLRSTVVDPKAKEALLLLLEQIMRDEQTRANLTQLLAHTFLQDAVKQNVGKTLSDSVHDVLSRRDVQNHAKEFVSGVVRDQTVQAQGGEAIWSTFTYALTPSWLSWIWENPGELAKDGGPKMPVADAAKVMVAAEDEDKQKRKGEATEQSASTEAKDTSKSPLQLKKTSSRSKDSGRAHDSAATRRTRTKRMSEPLDGVSKDEKSTESATKTASSHADFAERSLNHPGDCRLRAEIRSPPEASSTISGLLRRECRCSECGISLSDEDVEYRGLEMWTALPLLHCAVGGTVVETEEIDDMSEGGASDRGSGSSAGAAFTNSTGSCGCNCC
ncbi:hypothetical protein PF005_g22245 [Phytophthora fragariae]|uniref:Uncharacterized protein n=2 Tax=Phytophthora fragariae TaxID=53985 RepID=A0A6A3IX15_9STRA|nr:hypothetical protein PF011_g20988 [Phytophthora fragariae]KAE9081983.1 hypothetical protein PF010_g21771 [Phytophthora fragariae]KAE9106304.1 hypothetical protein PF006_g21400 [Phytophthora fragariae]KAE9183056.1 hypothetical protein PF005_g22245 [Phytophthora fragariae]KAE9286901.1 hypothetical protein PF001_g21230 [Phytophthora fragariae]